MMAMRRALSELVQAQKSEDEDSLREAMKVAEKALDEVVCDSEDDPEYKAMLEGYKYGVEHPEERRQAKELGFYPENQTLRIEWDRGFMMAVVARRLGENPEAMAKHGWVECSIEETSSIIASVLNAFGSKSRVIWTQKSGNVVIFDWRGFWSCSRMGKDCQAEIQSMFVSEEKVVEFVNGEWLWKTKKRTKKRRCCAS